MEKVLNLSCSLVKENENNSREIPKYKYIQSENYGLIIYKDREFILDIPDIFQIIEKNIFRLRDKDVYPSFCENYKIINYLTFLFEFSNNENGYYFFKNNNQYDLRRENVEYKHFYNKIIREHYPDNLIIEYSKGHFATCGKNSIIIKNPIWQIRENEKDILLMYCEKNTICKLCTESYKKILDYEKNLNDNKKLTFSKTGNGYIMTHCTNKTLSIHQIITGYYGNGRGTGGNNSDVMSIDHIDRDPLNNTMENLRIATRKEQEQNSKGIMPNTKRERQCIAQDLPEGITQDMLPKYVVYYNERALNRDYFRIERHPKLTKNWETTKSREVSIRDKLQQAINVIENLKNDIQPQTFTEKRQLPKHVSIIVRNDKDCLVYDERINGNIFNLKRILNEGYDLQRELILFNIDIHLKYPDKQLEGISLQLENQVLDKNEESKQKIKFIKYLKIGKDGKYNYLTYDERCKIPDSEKKLIFSIKNRLDDNYNLNDKLKELKQGLTKKYSEKFPDKVFNIPDEV